MSKSKKTASDNSPSLLGDHVSNGVWTKISAHIEANSNATESDLFDLHIYWWKWRMFIISDDEVRDYKGLDYLDHIVIKLNELGLVSYPEEITSELAKAAHIRTQRDREKGGVKKLYQTRCRVVSDKIEDYKAKILSLFVYIEAYLPNEKKENIHALVAKDIAENYSINIKASNVKQIVNKTNRLSVGDIKRRSYNHDLNFYSKMVAEFKAHEPEEFESFVSKLKSDIENVEIDQNYRSRYYG